MVVEHIIPLSVDGTWDVANLCLSCYRCNEFKGARLDAVDPVSGAVVPLFNPRTQMWHDHFAWSQDGLLLTGRTVCGRVTIEALRLNSDWLIRARHLWILAGLHPPLE